VIFSNTLRIQTESHSDSKTRKEETVLKCILKHFDSNVPELLSQCCIKLQLSIFNNNEHCGLKRNYSTQARTLIIHHTLFI